ncbi:hypothetical protein SAMN05216413_0906 [Ruminococcaceae bacterium KH2T8]|nr:hypothetical protein SAMN05216413_0906 [Ruminococcaceae bacterium KH2T8]
MNYYGTEKYKERMKMLDESIFSRIMFDEPEREKELESGYLVRYYYYADEENCKPGYAPVDGEICRLFKDDNLIFEWKNTDGHSRMASIIHHADGYTYFVFDEDLYGYSVLNLDSLQCMHFIPAESYGTYPDEFKETFIWCDCFYNPENNLLAVDGCFWACPGDVIVLDFKDPMTAVEPNDWHSIYRKYRCDDPDLDDIEFDSWDNDTLVCKAIGVKPDAIDLEGKCKVRFV